MCKKMIEFFIALMNKLCLKGNVIDQNQENFFEGRGPGAGGPGPGKWAGGRGPGNSNRHYTVITFTCDNTFCFMCNNTFCIIHTRNMSCLQFCEELVVI